MPDRILKESICTSETLNLLTDFEERFWNRLLVNCDDFGRFDARPAILKGRLFPLVEGKTLKNMSDTLDRLASVGLVALYEVDGRPFLQVVTWDKYQRIRAKRSKFPAPPDTCRQMTADDVKCVRNPIQSESNPNPNPNATTTTAHAREDVEVVIRDYCNKINATPGRTTVDELAGFAEVLGADVCSRAFDIALDAKPQNYWRYIQAILQNAQAGGVRCLADWDALQAKRDAAKKPTAESMSAGAWSYV